MLSQYQVFSITTAGSILKTTLIPYLHFPAQNVKNFHYFIRNQKSKALKGQESYCRIFH